MMFAIFSTTPLSVTRLLNLTLVWTIVVACLLTGISAPVLGQDYIGIYWDSSYSSVYTNVSTLPDFLTGYLVLKSPSTSLGISGWECCTEVDGPGQIIAWYFEGQAFNTSGAPCFRVGISGPPLPSQGDVLLATFQIMVTDSLLTTLSLRADFRPTLPLQMSYIPAENPGVALPMTSVTGQPEVAWINVPPTSPGWNVSPEAVDFGWLLVGGVKTEIVYIQNSGPAFFSLDISLDDPNAGFTIAQGSGFIGILPGQSHTVYIDFSPDAEGHFETILNLGPVVPPVSLAGNAETGVGMCSIHPDTLIFGPVNMGESETKTFSVTNHSNQNLYIRPTSDSPHFLPGNSSTLIPSQTRNFDITFAPQFPGAVVGTLDLGNATCADIYLAGNATPLPIGNGQNLVGIFFDPEFTRSFIETTQPNQIVPGYLVMLNPSETTGVGAWELAVGIDGDAQWLGWTLAGQAVNAGKGITASGMNEFVVGIGSSPLPYSSEILLANFEFNVVAPYPSIVNFFLEPIQFPSLPDQMVWAPWHDPAMLMPLEPATGTTIVAGINWRSPSGVDLPGSGALSRLLPNVPNPFNPMTEIRFELAKPQQARVAIYDVTGRLLKVVANGHLAAGPHSRVWRGRDSGGRQVPSGVYYVRMETGDQTDHNKIMLLK